MRKLVNILSFAVIIFCIVFFDHLSLGPNHDTNALAIEQRCDTDTVTTLRNKLNWVSKDFYQNKSWYIEQIGYSCDKQRMDWLLKQIIEGNFYTHKMDSCSLAILKESFTCNN